MGPQKIILFGGTFDPPHNGHMTLLAGAIEAVRPDLVLVEPAGTPPHKRAGGTSAAHRLAMCECFRPLFPELVLDTTEIARGGKSYTIDTVRQMNARYPGAQLYFPMGSDMLLWFRNWAAYRELLRRVVLVAHLRTGEDAAPVREYAAGLAAEGGTVLFAKAPVFPVSSTEVRALAANGAAVNVTAVVPICENRISDASMLPGDVITSFSGCVYLRTAFKKCCTFIILSSASCS